MAAFMSMLSARPSRSSCSSPEQDPAPAYEDLLAARQPAAGSAAAAAASAAAHCRDAAQDGSAAFMSMLSARPPRSSCSSPEQGPADEEDSDYSPQRYRSPSSRPHGGKPRRGASTGGEGRLHFPWTAEEHARLFAVVAEHGTQWSTVATYMPGRSGKQCRERYLNNRPEVIKGCWTVEEDLVIAQLHKDIGTRWTVIASHLPGRTHNCVKNRWNATNRSLYKDRAKSSTLLWDYTHSLQKRMTPAAALAAAIAALPPADKLQLGAVAGYADGVAAGAGAMDEVAFKAATTAAVAAAPAVCVYPAALLLLQPQQQPAAAEPAQGTGSDDALAMAAATVLEAVDRQLAAKGGSIPPTAADELEAPAAADPAQGPGSDNTLAMAAMVLQAVDHQLATGGGSIPPTGADEFDAATAAVACAVAPAEVKQAAAQPLRSTAVGAAAAAVNGRRWAHSNQPWQLHVPPAEWQQPQARALEQGLLDFNHKQQQVMAPDQQMAAGGLEGPLGGASLQQALPAATHAAASGNTQPAAAAVVAAAGMVQGTTGAAHRHPAAALAAGANMRLVLDLSDSAQQQQQQQQQQQAGSRKGNGKVSGSAAAAAPGSAELLHPSPAAAGGSMVSGLSGPVLDVMGYWQPQQLQLGSTAAGALSSAAPARYTGKRLLAACQDRQEELGRHLAPKVPPVPQPQQDSTTAPEDPTVASWWEQQEQHCTGGQQQAPPLTPAAAAAAAGEAVAAATALQQTNTSSAAASASAQQLQLAQLAATAEGTALLENLRALQLLPAELPAGAQLTLQLVVQPSAGTTGAPASAALTALDAAAATATAGTSGIAEPSVPAAVLAANGAAAVCAEPNSPAGSNCSSRSKAPSMDAAGTVRAAGVLKQLPCIAAHPGNSLAAAAATFNDAAEVTAGTSQAGFQQGARPAAAATAASASQGADTYAVGSKRPIGAVLPGEALSAAIAAAKRVLQDAPWQRQAAR
ncbi:hypothetical protein COO60DRAFT_1704709 [Scenedesmus sp. NREL 46B-D3]|nr:hypothetical protein COO60DRAFT_1704709 [Scenedesmus sp. NREL 46B-D3]